MAKKRGRKASAPKKMKSSAMAKNKSASVRTTPNRVKMVLNNFILFLILTLIFLILYFIVKDGTMYETFFWFLAMILGFISFALLISLLIMLFARAIKR